MIDFLLTLKLIINSPSIQETQRISSVDLSQDGRFVLVQLLSQEVHMWDIQSKKLVSHCQVSNSKPLSTIFLRASFGGPHDDFALSGTLGKFLFLLRRRSLELTLILQ